MKLSQRILKMFERNSSIIKAIFPAPVSTPKTFIAPDETSLYDTSNSGIFGYQQYISDQLQRNADDKLKYADYDLMDSEVPEISAALDIMADYVVYPDNINKTKVFKIRSKDSKTQKAIDTLDSTLNIHSEFHSMIREVCKYGDLFEEILVTKNDSNVVGFRNIPTSSMIVNMVNGMLDKTTPFKQIGNSSDPIATLQYDEVIHMSLNTDRNRYARYGKGVSRIEKSRLIYRQIRLMEEGMMISRLSRANQNYGILVDVGDLQGDEALDFMEKYKRKISRRKYVDPKTGRVSFNYNPLSVLEDIFVPIRQGSGAGIQALNNGDGVKNIDDINYFQNKLIYSTLVPKLLIGKEEDVNSKSTADTQYICFLRSIRRIQTLVEPEIIRFYRIALMSMGIKDPKITLEWPLTNTIDEERKWRIEQLKTNIGITLSDKALIDDYYFYQNFMGMSDDEIDVLTTRLDEEEQKYIDDIEDSIDDSPDAGPGAVGNTDGSEDDMPMDQTPTDSQVMNKFMLNMDENSKIGFKRIAEFLESSPETKKLIYEYIHLTNTQLGA